MFKLLAYKFINLAVSFIAITLVAFFLIRLIPGDPVLLMLGERGADAATYLEMKKNLGLDRPMPEQYVRFVGKLVHLDLGVSLVSKTPVWEEFKERFFATLELSVFAFIIAALAGLSMGILAALKRNSFWDYLVMGFSLFGYSMPIFWWGLMLILFFSVHLGLTPVSGRIDVLFDIPVWSGFLFVDCFKYALSGQENFAEGMNAFYSALRHLILPGLVLATIPLAVIARMTRSAMLEVLGEDFIRTTRAKGLSFFTITIKHALRNALIPIITVMGLMLSTLLTGAILTESIFSWPGIGKWMVNSITSRDYPVIQAAVVILASMVMTINLFVEMILVWANPRLRSHK